MKNDDINSYRMTQKLPQILQITQPSQYRYAKLQYRFVVTSGSPSSKELFFKKWLSTSELKIFTGKCMKYKTIVVNILPHLLVKSYWFKGHLYISKDYLLNFGSLTMDFNRKFHQIKMRSLIFPHLYKLYYLQELSS